MNLFSSPRFLPAVLWIDAASCTAMAAVHLSMTGEVAAVLGLPPTLVMLSGWVLVAAAVLAILGAMDTSRRAVIGRLIAGNARWVLGCAEVLLTAGGLTAFGQAWLVLQALAVGVLAELEFVGLRRAPRAALA